MLFSIIVPVYNVEQYLPECLESILNQTYKDFEVILVDDGSTDSSGVICDVWSTKYKNFKVIHKKNEGLLMARRTGLHYAKGEYVVHCDSDDYLDLQALEKIYKTIQDTQTDMVLYGYNVVDDEENVLENHYNIFENTIINKNDIIKKLVSTTWINNMWSKATKRSCIDIGSEYKSYSQIKMGEDVFQVVPLVKECNTFSFIAEPLYKYRFNPLGMSKNYTISYLYDFFAVSDRLIELCNSTNDKSIKQSFLDRFEHDAYKYMLYYLYQGISKKDYCNIYKDIRENYIFNIALSRRKCGIKSNLILRYITVPFLYPYIMFVMKHFGNIILGK